MDFRQLALNRHLLQAFCELHVPSVLRFRSGRSFKVWLDEPDPDQKLHNITTTATCIQSLIDCPPRFRGEADLNPAELAADFAVHAMRRPQTKWKSEQAARIYSRCRGLPLAVTWLPETFLAEFTPELRKHIRVILRQVKREPSRFAVGEAYQKDNPRTWYPPNAYHTYWALDISRRLRERFPGVYGLLEKELGLSHRQNEMLLWARRTLGFQISLHTTKSAVLNTDQLAWSLGIVARYAENVRFDLEEQDFLGDAVNCLFTTQLQTGTWRHYRALFHYPTAGNAYCYVFETFAELLRVALLPSPGGEFLRDRLKSHVESLLALWRYGQATQIPLGDDGKAIGWCSGHRINQSDPEGWATASIFSFAQHLRRLLGVWTRDAGLEGLNRSEPKQTTAEAISTIEQWGQVWQTKAASVANELKRMFIGPVKQQQEAEATEPDHQPIAGTQARSAILYGPPGTGKTTLARSLAAALGWKYVELHSSHFVAAGLSQVQRTADEIFSRLMEIDHCVILFDEIDELVREREREHDAFGRFLTTSMLPKLAELWKQRKVIYLVATNHILYFDRAITRGQRFDALLFVPPPSFEVKIEVLRERLRKALPPDTEVAFSSDLARQIETALAGLETAVHEVSTDKAWEKQAKKPIENNLMLAKFTLLRYEQLVELAAHLIEALADAPQKIVTADTLWAALSAMCDQRLTLYGPYLEFHRDVSAARRFFG